jgi:short-subunit dehydrogenase
MMPVTFLTGASSGFGAALAPLIAREGHAIALIARRKNEIEQLAGQIKSSGGNAIAISCDVGDRNAVQEAVRECEKEMGPITRLIANAGIGEGTPAKGFSAEVVEQIMRVNYLGMVYCIEATLPGMLERGKGQLVGISSLAGYRGLPGMGGYCASKAAMISMLESLRIELREQNIAVTIICPGFVKTAMTEKNPKPMPFLMELDDAARIMHQAMVRKKTRITFPWQLAAIVKVARCVPDSLYDRSFRVSMR